MDYYRDKKKVKIDKEKDEYSSAKDLVYEEWWWDLQQKKVSGLAFFDYREMVDKYLSGNAIYIDQDQFQEPITSNSYYSTGGYVLECTEREAKKKGKYCTLHIESNYEFIWVNIFPDQYKLLIKDGMDLINSVGSLILLSGMIKYDDYKKQNILKVWENSEVIILK